jgi:hypothetical protein
MRLRRRERHLWADTPLAKIFTPQRYVLRLQIVCDCVF